MTAAAAMTYPTTNKIGFWTRTIAYIIDAVLLTIVTQVLYSLLFGGDQVRGSGLGLLIDLAYFMYFWSSYGHGQTLGMKALNIRVVKTDGTELTLVTALIRFIGLGISIAVILIGVIWVAFDANKQGWHDKIAGTYVVKA